MSVDDGVIRDCSGRHCVAAKRKTPKVTFHDGKMSWSRQFVSSVYDFFPQIFASRYTGNTKIYYSYKRI